MLTTFEAAHAAAAPVYDMADIADDPHYAERGTIVEVDGVRMQGLIAKLSKTQGRILWAGPALGAHYTPSWSTLPNWYGSPK